MGQRLNESLQVKFPASKKLPPVLPCAIVVFVLATAYGFQMSAQTFSLRTKKFLMPGTRQTYLAPGLYAVWFFSKWPGTKVSNEDSLKTLSIEGADKRCVELRGHLGGSFDGIGKHGIAVYIFELDKGQMYKVSAQSMNNEPFVLALVPGKMHHYDLGSRYTFHGVDDNRFEPTLTSSAEEFILHRKNSSESKQ